MSYSNLTELFTATAEAIRGKTGRAEPIVANAFPAAIEGISAGGGGGDIAALIDGTIENFSDNEVTKIRRSAFFGCGSLKTVSVPNCKYIDGYAFASCSRLESIYAPSCETIQFQAFVSCPNLSRADFPNCVTLSNNGFSGCKNLTSVNFPILTGVGTSAFNGCSSLTDIEFPAVATIRDFAFINCINLKNAKFPSCKLISTAAFTNCYNLISFYLMSNSICSLSTSGAFASTPIAGYSASAGQFGSIFVPASLLTTYQSATNWAYYSERFVGV